MRLCIYQKFPLYPVKRQFPILSQNNYSMIEVDKCSQHSASEISTKISIYQEILVCRRFEYIGVKSYQYTTWESFSIFHVCRLVFNEWSYQSSNKHAFCYLCASNTATVDICNKGAYAETNLCPTHKRNINFTLLFLHLNQQINISQVNQRAFDRYKYCLVCKTHQPNGCPDCREWQFSTRSRVRKSQNSQVRVRKLVTKRT